VPLDRAIGELAGRQYGLVGRRQLLALGLSAGGIQGRLLRGQLHQVHRGVYAVGHRALIREGRWMAAVLACGSGAVLSHRTAGELWGILPRSEAVPEVTRPQKFKGRPGIRCHHAVLSADEVDIVDGIPVTSVHRTIFDLAATQKRRRVERAMNETEVRGLTDRISIPQLLKRYPRHRGAATLRSLMAEKAPGGVTQNDFEEGFAEFLAERALPRPAFNAPVSVRGRHFVIDCLWRDRRLAVELDGRAVHGTAAAFESDRERDRILQAEGWRTARITWRQLRDDPEALAADLRRLLGTL
jgi:very-short-patch-repair endonuclease